MRRFAPLFVAVLALTSLTLPMTAVHAASAPCKPGSGVKLRGKDLTSVTLPLDLRCADLTGAKLDEVDLTGKDLTGAVLRKASLKEADLGRARAALRP